MRVPKETLSLYNCSKTIHMLKTLTHSIIKLLLFLAAPLMYCQNPPTLGVAGSFALFTATGAFGNVGAGTTVTGDIGTNVGAFTGFPPGIVIGSTHVANAVSAQAATDVNTAYSYLSGLTCGPVLGVTLGNGQILTPNVYCIGAAATLTGSLFLNGQGNPNAIFIIKIDGALSTAASSSVVLTNGASLCNLYWQINGKVSLGPNSFFKGTIVANGEIELLQGATLSGRGLSAAGAISLLNNTVNIGLTPAASTISSNGATAICAGSSVILSGNNGGTWNNGAVSSTISVNTGGNYFVTNTTGCGSITSNSISVTVNPAPNINLGSDTTICGCITLNAGSPGATYQWSTGQDYAVVTICTSGTYWVNVSNGVCVSTDTIQITVSQPPLVTITATNGSEFTLNAGNQGSTFLWNTGATTQTIVASTSGIYSVTVSNAYGCIGSDTSLVIISDESSIKPLQLFPNPTNDKSFTLKFNVYDKSTVLIRIWNSLGCLVYDEALENFKGSYNKKLALQHLANGIYCAEVISGGKSRILKVILH